MNDALAMYFADVILARACMAPGAQRRGSRSRMGCIASTMTHATDGSGPAQDALNEHATEDVVF